MSLDLTEAEDLAGRALFEAEFPGEDWSALFPETREVWVAAASPAVATAAPLIEAQVRAQVAAEIEAALPPSVVTVGSEVYVAGIRDGLHMAARLARGESS